VTTAGGTATSPTTYKVTPTITGFTPTPPVSAHPAALAEQRSWCSRVSARFSAPC